MRCAGIRGISTGIVLGLLAGGMCLPCCGEASDCRMSTSVLAGVWTEEEARALTRSIERLECAGYSDPGYYVTFIWTPEHPFRGAPWAEFRVPKYIPEAPEEGYKGYCDWGNCVVYVRRFGNAERHLDMLLDHELLHAVGFRHGSEMNEAERKVRECQY